MVTGRTDTHLQRTGEEERRQEYRTMMCEAEQQAAAWAGDEEHRQGYQTSVKRSSVGAGAPEPA